jgi:amidohydrolase
MPQQSRDPLVIASALVGSLQTILSRNVAPLDTCVLSVTQIHAGAAYNVVPDTAMLAGTIRYFKDEVIQLAETRMRELCAGFATAYGVQINCDVRNVFDVLMNDADLSDAYMEAAADIVGRENISGMDEPATGSEDYRRYAQSDPWCLLPHRSFGHDRPAQPQLFP